MRYFCSHKERLSVDHVMASGALPPAFPAIRVDGDPYWDGGIYSNTPIEAVLDDNPRRESLVFAVQLWRPEGQARQRRPSPDRNLYRSLLAPPEVSVKD